MVARSGQWDERTRCTHQVGRHLFSNRLDVQMRGERSHGRLPGMRLWEVGRWLCILRALEEEYATG